MKKKLKIRGISTLALILVLVIGIGAVFFGEIRTLASFKQLNEHPFYEMTYYADYNLDEFLKLLQLLPKDSNEDIIKDFKERFKKDYDETSEALEWHIETLVNFGGDSTHKIYKAMIEVINDIINDAPSTDKDGMIEYLQEMM